MPWHTVDIGKIICSQKISWLNNSHTASSHHPPFFISSHIEAAMKKIYLIFRPLQEELSYSFFSLLQQNNITFSYVATTCTVILLSEDGTGTCHPTVGLTQSNDTTIGSCCCSSCRIFSIFRWKNGREEKIPRILICHLFSEMCFF